MSGIFQATASFMAGLVRRLRPLLLLLISGPAGASPQGPAPSSMPDPPRQASEPVDPFQDRASSWREWLRRNPPAEAHPEPGYRFHSEVHHELAALVDARPHCVRPLLVGNTLKGEPVWGYQLRDPSRPTLTRVLVFASIHPMEWISTEVTVALARWFVAHPVPGVSITLIPVLNVDGRLMVEDDLLAGRNAYRRGNAGRVDLNRDFAVHHDARSFWRHIFPGFHRASPAPLSQPESAIIDRLAAGGDYHLAVSLHAFGGYIFLPWSGRWERPEGWEELEALGQAMSQGQRRRPYKVMQLSRWGFFFRAQGSELDHLYGAHGVPTVLVELTRSGLSPWAPRDWARFFRWYNPPNPGEHVQDGLDLLRGGIRHLAREGAGEGS